MFFYISVFWVFFMIFILLFVIFSFNKNEYLYMYYSINYETVMAFSNRSSDFLVF